MAPMTARKMKNQKKSYFYNIPKKNGTRIPRTKFLNKSKLTTPFSAYELRKMKRQRAIVLLEKCDADVDVDVRKDSCNSLPPSPSSQLTSKERKKTGRNSGNGGAGLDAKKVKKLIGEIKQNKRVCRLVLKRLKIRIVEIVDSDSDSEADADAESADPAKEINVDKEKEKLEKEKEEMEPKSEIQQNVAKLLPAQNSQEIGKNLLNMLNNIVKNKDIKSALVLMKNDKMSHTPGITNDPNQLDGMLCKCCKIEPLVPCPELQERVLKDEEILGAMSIEEIQGTALDGGFWTLVLSGDKNGDMSSVPTFKENVCNYFNLDTEDFEF